MSQNISNLKHTSIIFSLKLQSLVTRVYFSLFAFCIILRFISQDDTASEKISKHVKNVTAFVFMFVLTRVIQPIHIPRRESLELQLRGLTEYKCVPFLFFCSPAHPRTIHPAGKHEKFLPDSEPTPHLT